ncbi:hypothetical protein DMN91_005052 [Ooceraea biroi]|uniref:mTERF domain-containing protein 1, mitochondrial n=1 Tax=Ooceraea biroi TaxID=2015173 RepID=A0A026WBC8_OOCBI|nr:transcription termination factor 3, mitochondrial [Ooceraea biroi]EZA53365.1 mTERF domain-containing protein 1, mitochondrial [Ooceraea biroi]RLU22774.1 hypothetical protein DMN91_005052 [Ooceraea biroi]
MFNMPFQRCYSLVSMTRPVATNLITRFISRSPRLGQCLPKDTDKSQDNIMIPESNILSNTKTDDGGYTLEPHSNLNNNASATPVARIQQIITSVPNEDSLDDSEIDETLPEPLDRCTEDISDIGPYLTPTCTFAKYANKSRTVQQLVKLGVSLYKLESNPDVVKFILGLDFERDIQPYIRFLHDCGVPANYLGKFLTKNPHILKVDMDDLHTRIRYLRAHEFSTDLIKDIICNNPNWLLYSTKDIDGRLGYFQATFKLNGSEVRFLTSKAPKVVTYKMSHLMSNTLTIKEDMEFDPRQAKVLLIKVPKIWVKNRTRLLDTFEYAHNEMQLQRNFVVQMPHILLCRKTRLQQRHSFLVEMKRAQYDPTKPMYVSPRDLISGTDVDFCKNIAKTSVEVYNEFQKLF